MAQQETTQGSTAFCQACGLENPTRFVDFRQQIGLLVIRLQKRVRANLCKRCINKVFWPFTLITALLGWWGIISLFMTPIFLINNIYYYLRSVSLPATNAQSHPS